MTPRNLNDVIGKILLLIPEGRHVRTKTGDPDVTELRDEWDPLRGELQRLGHSVGFLAPEMQGGMWAAVANKLEWHLGPPPYKEEWKMKILNLFNGKDW